MTTKDVRNRCRIELNAKSDGAYDLFVNEELDEFISFGIRQFYARRLSGFTSDRTSFEQWQKRSDDLRCVYAKSEISMDSVPATKNGVKIVHYTIPDDYLHMLSEDIEIIRNTETYTSQGAIQITSAPIGTFDVFECTTDNLTARMNDSLGEHIFSKNRMRPLRLYMFLDDTSFTPAKRVMKSALHYKAPSEISLGKYTIEYIKSPELFGIYSKAYKLPGYSDDTEINQVPDHAWDEVLSIAIKHALENSSSYRLQTYNAERAEIQ